MRPRTRHALALVAALPLLGGSICGEVLADISQRELILEPVEPHAFDVEAWFARLDAVFGPDFMPKGREQPAVQERNWNDD